MKSIYRKAGKFRGVQYSQIGDLLSFHTLTFADVCNQTNMRIYMHACFMGLIFVVCQYLDTSKISCCTEYLTQWSDGSITLEAPLKGI